MRCSCPSYPFKRCFQRRSSWPGLL